MKIHYTPAPLALAIALLTCPCQALTAVTDNFNSNSLNQNRWLLEESGNARIFPANGRLNFTVLPRASQNGDFADIVLRNNRPSYNENWQAILDVKNDSGGRADVGIGLWINKLGNLNNAVFLEFFGKESGRNGGFIASFLRPNGTLLRPLLFKNFTPASKRQTVGSVRIAFNAQNKRFTFFVDRTGAENGYQWVKVGTFSVTGVGGDRAVDWNMNANSRFEIAVGAFGFDHQVPRGRVFAQRFVLKR